MNAGSSTVLYTPDILALAVELADYPLDDGFEHRAAARSRICGSRVELGLDTSADARITGVGARVTACAVGQAAAALFLRSAIGTDRATLEAAHQGVAAWLAGAGSVPQWPHIAALDAARGYPARHPAILLPWKAALDALSNS